MSLERLIIFLRAPRLGGMKTRLRPALGQVGTRNAYRRLVETLLSRLSRVPTVELRFTPADAEPDIRPWLRPGWLARPQEEGDLGARMQSAFSAAFRSGAQRVVIIGSDCPDVTADDVASAWRALLTDDLVLGPATDGGYWLIGLRRPHPVLFHQIPWSTNQVFGETLRRAAGAGLRVQTLRQLEDVDTPEAWQRFLERSA